MSLEKGLLANVGKVPIFKPGQNTEGYVDLMLFLLPNGASVPGQQASQIVNAHFPSTCFDVLKEKIGRGDYVRVKFHRLGFSKPHPVVGQSNNVVNYLTVKATDIEVLRKAKERTPAISEKAPTESEAQAYRVATSGQ